MKKRNKIRLWLSILMFVDGFMACCLLSSYFGIGYFGIAGCEGDAGDPISFIGVIYYAFLFAMCFKLFQMSKQIPDIETK